MRNFRINKLKEKLFNAAHLGSARRAIATINPKYRAKSVYGHRAESFYGHRTESFYGCRAESRYQSRKGLINAFSLAEILIVLAIMGILIMLVVPNNAGVATRSKSLEAQQELKMIHTLQEAYRMQYSKYSMDISQLNYIPHKLVTTGGTANYEVTVIEASTTGYKAKAEAVVDFNGDGKKNVWEIDQGGVVKEIQPD